MKKGIALCGMVAVFSAKMIAQNVGINKTNPRFPLSFSNKSGQKISFWDDGNEQMSNYGIGVLNGDLKIHTYTKDDDIVFGYGNSTVFNEKFRFKANGFLGIGVSDPQFYLDVSGSAWLKQKDPQTPPALNFMSNSNENFAGMAGNNVFGFGTSFLGKNFPVLQMNTNTGNMSYYDDSPLNTSAFNFSKAYGQKISLYPGTTGDVGFAVLNPVGYNYSFLALYSDNPNADVAIGYDQYSNGFNERFAIKPTGALAIMGNRGNTGNLLQSNGPGLPASWGTNTDANTPVMIYGTAGSVVIGAANSNLTALPGLTNTYNLAAPAQVRIDYEIEVDNYACFACGQAVFEIVIDNRQGSTVLVSRDYVDNDKITTARGSVVVDAPAGTNYIDMYVRKISGPEIYVGGSPLDYTPYYMIFEIID